MITSRLGALLSSCVIMHALFCVGSIKGRGAPRRSMPVFFTLSQANARRMQDMPGGDEARVNFLTTALGLQMVGRAGLTP